MLRQSYVVSVLLLQISLNKIVQNSGLFWKKYIFCFWYFFSAVARYNILGDIFYFYLYSTLLLIGFDFAEDKHNSTDLPLPKGYDV